ncbi:MAG TPA: metal-dependent hydrolase, partial [Catalimonadaceae bacterium]|nr:metal-dependent hydrolase [Catalimonadaceae bacterium]
MDSLTHIVFGATLGEVVLGKKIGKKALLFGAIANTIPDLDVFLVFGDPIREITIHRGFSHSIVFPFLIAPFLAWLAFRFVKDSVSWKEWFLFFFVLILTHPLLDSLTAYGTQLFLPFSDFRVNFSNLFIVDVAFTLPMLIAAISLWIMKRNNGGRQNLARRALIISGLYVFLSLSAKLYVNGVFSESLVKKGIQSTHQMTGTTPFNILLWYTVAEVDSGYFVGDYSLLDPDQNIPYLFLRRNEHLLEGYRNEYATDRMIWFSNHFFSVEKVKNETRFFTLKFGMTGFDLSRPLSESVPFYY